VAATAMACLGCRTRSATSPANIASTHFSPGIMLPLKTLEACPLLVLMLLAAAGCQLPNVNVTA
jgi:hypothetical protein